MGNNKNTLLILVVVILFGASGVVLYKGFFGKTGSTVTGSGAEKVEIVNLLPYGTKLNFESVAKHAETGANVVYEKVNPDSVGLDLYSLISPVKDVAPAPINVSGQRGQRLQ